MAPRIRGVTPWAVTAIAWGGCALITDFDYQPDAATSASVSSTGSGGSGGSGGHGGGGGCSDDLGTDPANCGVCGFTCGDEACVEGACGQCVDLVAGGSILDRVIVYEDVLFFVQRVDSAGGAGGAGGGGEGGAGGRAPGAYIRTLDIDFTKGSTPGLDHPIENGVTNVALGTIGDHRVYVTGQVSTLIYACQASGCLEFDVGNTIVQINGMTAIDDKLYFVAENRLMSLDIDARTGLPKATPNPEVTTYEEPILNAGVLELFHTVDPEPRLYWGTYDVRAVGNGCVYRVDVDDLPFPQVPGLPCYSAKFATAGFVLAGDGTVYAQDGATTVQKISGDPPPAMTEFDTNATFPRGWDDDYLYMRDATSGSLRARPLAGGPSVTTFSHVPGTTALYGLDSHHARYVVATAGSHLCRWPKPTP